MPKPVFIHHNISQIIKVNHAGEYGAKQIYLGQLRACTSNDKKEQIKHMLEQELRHLEYFERLIKEKKSTPTLLLPLWHYGSYLMGYSLAKIFKNGDMVCTEAVETVISDHYQSQIDYLNGKNQLDDFEKELKINIEKFKQEENDHKEIAEKSIMFHFAPHEKIISKLVQNICKVAIFLSKKI